MGGEKLTTPQHLADKLVPPLAWRPGATAPLATPQMGILFPYVALKKSHPQCIPTYLEKTEDAAAFEYF